MSEAADFSYFYFMDEYLSILSPSREWFHHLKKKIRILIFHMQFKPF